MKFKVLVICLILFVAGAVPVEAVCEFTQNTLTIEVGVTMELAYSSEGTIPFCTSSDPDVAQVFRNGGRWEVFGKSVGSAEIILYEVLENAVADSMLYINVTERNIQQEDKKKTYHSGDDFSTTVNDGSSGWIFEMSNDGKMGLAYTPLPKSIPDGWYDGIGRIFCRAAQTNIVPEQWAARTFVAPEDGVIRIYDAEAALPAGAYFKILKNERVVYPTGGKAFVEGNGNFMVEGQEIRVAAGDKIRFCYIAKTSDMKIWTQQRVEYINFGGNDAFISEKAYIQEGELKLLEYCASGNGRMPECTSSNKNVVFPVLLDDKWYILGMKAGEAQVFLRDSETGQTSFQTVQVSELAEGDSPVINMERLAMYENQTIPIACVKSSETVCFSVKDPTVCEIMKDHEKFYIKGKMEGSTELIISGENGLTQYCEVQVLKSYPAIRQFIQGQSTVVENQGTEDRTVFSVYAVYNDEAGMIDSDCRTELIKSGAGSIIVQRGAAKEGTDITKYMLWESITSMRPLTDVVSSIYENSSRGRSDVKGGE